ncbi:MAG: hypothetical protein IPM76_12470 [Chloroflexi bacterium]|nr:hypothetical protein [Chloroflexota bacterium]
MKRIALFSCQAFPASALLAPAVRPAPAADEATLPTDRWWCAPISNRQMVADLAATREPWEVNGDQGSLVIDVTPTRHDQLQKPVSA